MTRKELLILRVVEYISQEGAVSRTRIARALNLSKASVTHITRQLIEFGIATEVAVPKDAYHGPSGSGRRAVPLRINPDAGLLIGIDLSGSRIVGVVLNMALTQHARLEFDWPALLGETITRDDLIGVLEGIMLTLGSGRALVRGIGISVRALNYNPAAPGNGSLMNVDANKDLVRALENHYRTPAFVVHNMQALLLAEMIGRPQANLSLLIHVGEGIGGAIWLDNKPIEGSHNAAGEWGHITIDPNGTPCACGKRGCIEAHYAIPHMVARARAENAAIANWADFVRRQHEPPCQNLLQEFAQVAAQALAGAVTVCDPSEIIINGPICEVAEVFVPAFKTALEALLIPRTRKTIEVLVSKTGLDAAARGAACALMGAALAQMVTEAPLRLEDSL
jgi:predicted NBD/HSP70 family sugar kinase